MERPSRLKTMTFVVVTVVVLTIVNPIRLVAILYHFSARCLCKSLPNEEIHGTNRREILCSASIFALFNLDVFDIVLFFPGIF